MIFKLDGGRLHATLPHIRNRRSRFLICQHKDETENKQNRMNRDGDNKTNNELIKER